MSGREARKIEEYLEVPAARRLNPNSVRRLLFQFVEQAFDRNCVSAADALSKAPRGVGTVRNYQKGFSGEVLYNLTRDDKSVTYPVLDAFARYHSVPLSLVLIFTRIHSELEDPDRRSKGQHLSTIRALKAAISAIEEAAIQTDPQTPMHRQFDYSLFQKIREVYLDQEGDRQLPY